jgi:hypothetical protein
MKQAAQELGDKLHQLAQRSPTAAASNGAHCTADAAAAAAASGSGSRAAAVIAAASGERLDFSFNLPRLEIPAGLSADLTGFPASSARSQQQQMPGSTAAEAGQHQVPLRALDARDALNAASLEQQDSSSVGGRSSPSLSVHVPHADDAAAMQQQQQQWLAADADAGIAGAVGGCVTMSVAALSQLQAAAQHHQRRSNKWKAKCRQLAQHLGTLNAELQQLRLPAAAGAKRAAVTGAAAGAAAALPAGREVAEMRQHRQQGDSADAAAAIACGQQEITQLRQQLTAAQQVSWTCLDCRTWLVTAQLLSVHLPLCAQMCAEMSASLWWSLLNKVSCQCTLLRTAFRPTFLSAPLIAIVLLFVLLLCSRRCMTAASLLHCYHGWKQQKQQS